MDKVDRIPEEPSKGAGGGGGKAGSLAGGVALKSETNRFWSKFFRNEKEGKQEGEIFGT